MSQSQKKNSSAVSSQESAAKRPSTPPRPSSRPPAPNKWVAVQLSSVGEREKNLEKITKAVHQILRSKLEVFIPAISQKVREESETVFFMDGYIFIQHAPNIQYLNLQETTYFSTVLCSPTIVNGRRQQQYSLLSDKDLDSMRTGTQKLKTASYAEGNNIRITKGVYKNLPGVVSLVYEGNQNVQVAIHLRSKKGLLMDFPVTYIRKESDG